MLNFKLEYTAYTDFRFCVYFQKKITSQYDPLADQIALDYADELAQAAFNEYRQDPSSVLEVCTVCELVMYVVPEDELVGKNVIKL